MVATNAVSKVSDGTEKNTVLGNTSAENLVADSKINTNGAVLTTATLDFSSIFPKHKVGDVTVLDDMTLEMTMFQQNYYGLGDAETKSTLKKSAARFGPFTTARYIHDNQTYADTTKLNPLVPADESFGFMAHTTFGYSSTGGSNTAIITDLNPIHTTNYNKKVYGNYRLQTFSVGAIFDFTVAEDATEGTFTFDYARDAKFVADYPTGKYDARYSGHWVGKESPAAAHNNFWFGGNLPFAYRALRMYDRALTEAELAQNHAAELLDYYQVDLFVYNLLSETERAMANEDLSTLRLGETSKEEIESIINTDEYKEMTYNYADLYIRDGLVYLWSGEGNELPASGGQSLLSLENQVGENALTLMTSQRGLYKNNDPLTITSGFLYVVDKGVLKASNDKDLVIENLVPYRTATDASSTKVLKDMTVEVSQMYPETYKLYKSQANATLATRGWDADNLNYGPVTSNNFSKAVANCFYHTDGNYYIAYSYTAEGAGAAQTVYANLTASISTSNGTKFTLYTMQEDGTMVAHPDLVDMYVDYSNGNNMVASVDPDTQETVYIDASSRFSPKISRYNHMTTYQSTSSAFDDAKNGPVITATFGNYDKLTTNSPLVYMNAKPNEAFTNSFSLDFNESNSAATSFGYTFTIGRNGETLDYTKTGTYKSTTASHAKFSIGLDAYTVFYGIRIYDRVLNDKEQAHNNFIDIAFQLDANLFDFIHAKQSVKDYVLDATSGTSVADWTKDSLEELIDEAYEEALPYYYELYVQDGLTFLWTGEGNAVGVSETKVSSLPNLLGGELAIDKVTYGRQGGNYASPSSYQTKAQTGTVFMADEGATPVYNPMSNGGYYVVDKGVVSRDNYKMILTELMPTATVDNKTVLTDMTLEVSQMYFDDIKVSNSKYASALGTSYVNRGNDGGQNWFGPLGALSHTKMTYNAKTVGTDRYYALMYKDANGDFHSFYRKNTTASILTSSLYTYNESTNTMTEITDADTLAWIRAVNASNQPINIWITETKQYLSTSYDVNNPYKSYPAMDANGVMGVHSMISGYDDAGKPQFINNTVNQPFTTTMIFDYADVATTTTYDVILGRDGAVLGTPYNNKAYSADTDYSYYTTF